MTLIPMAILKDKHAPDDNSIVAMRFKDFKKILRGLPIVEETNEESD